MGRLKENGDDREPAPIPIASTRDLENFKARRIEPAESYFRLDVEGTQRSPWNKALATVFARSFIESTWYQGESSEFIAKAFSVHLQTLIKNWKAQQRRSDIDIQDDNDLQKGLNSDQRRRSVRIPIKPDPLAVSIRNFQLWKRRYQAAASRKELSGVTKVLKDAGMGVVSADEADGDVSRNVILQLRWRSAEATWFLRNLDKVHIANKYKATGKPGPGRWPTPRVPSTKRMDEHSEAPVRLPMNFYDGDWLHGIGAEARKELHVQPRVELTFSGSTKK
jgi:hypothetical protein